MQNTIVAEGQRAPDFCLPDADENERCLQDYEGKWVIVYFYPKDNTPGCSLEAMDFSRLKRSFETRGAIILGISKDTCKSHQRFIDRKSLTITLLSDTDSAVQKQYGIWRPKKFIGRELLGTVRSTFLINPQGIIEKIWDPARAKGHADDVLETLKESLV